MLGSALQGLSQANLDLGVFQQTKVTDRVHTCASAGYHVFENQYFKPEIRGVDVIYWDTPHFQVEALQTHGPNMLIFQVASGGQCWFIFRCYIAPYDTVTMKLVVAAIDQCPCGAAIMVDREFNTNLEAPEVSIRKEEITAAIVTSGMEDMPVYFLPRCKSYAQDKRAW